MNISNLLEEGKRHLSPALARATEIVMVKGEGPYIYASNNKKYIDFVSGIAVNNLGHCHPKVVFSAKQQLDDLIHGSLSLGYYPSALKLSIELSKVTPGMLDVFFFSNSGSEAVEGAIKLARYKTKKHGIIAFQGAFHGRTMGALSVTSTSSGYREHYAPFLSNVIHVPYPYCYRCPYGNASENCSIDCFNEINRVFDCILPPSNTAAILFEPVQGEGGYIVPPVKYVKSLRKICDEHDILLIFDEVQTGFGRTGKMFATEYFSVIPDIMCLGKAIANGLPLSAVVSSTDIMSVWTPGSHGSTFGANPVSCAAALAVLEVIQEENMLENCILMGKYLKQSLFDIKEKSCIIGDVRGLGLMIAVELIDEDGNPNAKATKSITKYCAEKGLLFYNCGIYKNCIRFIAPLNIEKSVLDEALDIFKKAVEEYEKRGEI